MRRLPLLLLMLSLVHPSASVRVSAEATARYELNNILVRSESHSSTYSRDRFKSWIDADHDCENTRAEVLKNESSVNVTESSTCRVLTGHWWSLYDGVTTNDASTLDIDHVVALAEAWRSGAWAWTDTKRMNYANDLAHSQTLRAVTSSTNRSKNDSDPSDWRPPRYASWCRYAEEWIRVKYVWSLSANSDEVSTLKSMLNSCA